MVTIENVLILGTNFPLPVWALGTKSQIAKIILGEEFNLKQRIE